MRWRPQDRRAAFTSCKRSHADRRQLFFPASDH
jgi:hypothetical protein